MSTQLLYCERCGKDTPHRWRTVPTPHRVVNLGHPCGEFVCDCLTAGWVSWDIGSEPELLSEYIERREQDPNPGPPERYR